MTLKEFKTIARLLKKAYKELEREAVKDGIDLMSPEYAEIIDTIRVRVLEENGYTLQEYRDIKETYEKLGKTGAYELYQNSKKVLENANDKLNKVSEFISETQDTIEQVKRRKTLSEKEVEDIARDIAKEFIQPPQITNQIVKEITQPINTTRIVKEQYNDKELKNKIFEVEKTIEDLRIDIPKILGDFQNEFKNNFAENFKDNIDTYGMPDFRKLAMGLQGQIDALSSGGVGGGTPSSPLNSVQYNLAGAFAGDSNFTRVQSTQETQILKDMTTANVVTGLQLSEDMFGSALPASIPGSAIGLINSGASPSVYLTGVASDLTNIIGIASEGLLSGGIDTTSGDNLFLYGTYLTAPTVPTSGFYYSISNTSGTSLSELIINPTVSKVVFTDTSTTLEASVKAGSTGADLLFYDTAGTQDAQVSVSSTFCRFRFTADGTNIYNAVLEDGLFAVRQINGWSNFLKIDMINDVYSIGDIDAVDNGNRLVINDSTSSTTLFTPSLSVQYNSKAFLAITSASGLYQFGDLGGLGNTSYLNIDDSNKTIELKASTTATFGANGTSKYFFFDVSGGGAESYVTGGNNDTAGAPVGIVYTAYDNQSATNGNGAHTKLRSGAGSGNLPSGSVYIQTFVVGTNNSGQQLTTQDNVEFNYLKSSIFGGRVTEKKGANVTAANDLALGYDGNTFVVTGNTQINGIATSGWQSGSHITLIFTGTPTVKHNTAASAGYASLYLNGSADLVAANNTVLCLVYDGSVWQETSRKVA